MQAIETVAYARFSSDKQQESSITVQLAEIRKFCAIHNLNLVHEYVDEAQTGTNANRKDFQQMIRDASLGKFKMVVVHRMDRWARNVDDARYYKKYLKKLGVRIISTLEDFEETPEGEFFELMSMGMAELYSKKLARESIAGKLANAKECRIHGGTPLLGYKVQGKKYVIDEKEAEAVRIIFEMTLQGYGYVTIRNYLNTNGYRRSDGRLYTIHLYDVLRNRKYIGEYVYNKAYGKDFNGKRNSRKTKSISEVIRIKGGLPRIIDDRTFFKVQEILDQRKKRAAGYDPKTKYLLTGLTRCGHCGKAYCGGTMTSHDRKYPTYRCNGEKDCISKAVNAAYLEDYIYKLFYNVLFAQENESNLTELLKLGYIKVHDDLQTKIQAIDKEIKEKEKLIKDNKAKMTQDELKTLKKYMEEHNSQLEWEIGELKQDKVLLKERKDLFPEFKIKRIIRNISKYKERLRTTDKDELRETIFELINTITITNENIEFVINFHRLLNGYEPIHISVFERRDNIARQENHYLQSLTFNKLSVKM